MLYVVIITICADNYNIYIKHIEFDCNCVLFMIFQYINAKYNKYYLTINMS